MSFLIGIANAQGFWVKFIDGDNDGVVNFSLYATSNETQNYYTGIAPYDNTNNRTELLQIPADSSSSISFEISPGIYDIYLTSDNITFYWTSQGDAEGKSTSNTVTIDWAKGCGIKIYNFYFSFSGDKGELVAVPLPSALWLLGSSVIVFSVIRKKLLPH